MATFMGARVKDAVPPWLLPQGTGDHDEKALGANVMLILAWALVWLVSHLVIWSAWNPRRCVSLMFSPTPADRYRRRLARGQVYCFIASVGGFDLLFYRTEWSALSLLNNYSPEHEMLFAMAAGHWIVSIWEDMSNWQYLAAGLSDKDVFDTETPPVPLHEYMGRAQLVHHWCAFCGYCIVLHTKACVGVCMFGLLFELPVLLMNHREFALNTDRPPAWFRDEESLKRFWIALHVVFLVARGGPMLVYLYSLFHWVDDILALPLWQAATYHGMAWFFTLINYTLLFTFFPKWHIKDMGRAQSGQGRNEKQRKDARLERLSAEEEGLIKQDVPPVQVVPPHILQKYDGSGEDGTLWVEVDAIVYDVTYFQNSHPGGGEVFRKYGGKDASEDFHRARHSFRAKRQMQEYMVGPLKRTTTRYRIFEHEDELRETTWEILQAMATYLFTVFLLYWSGLHQSQIIRHRASLISLSVPGCVLMIVASGVIFAARIMTGSCRCVCFHPSVHVLALALNVFAISLVVVRLPLPEAVGASCPTGLELSMGAIFIIEELREVLRGGKGVLTSKAFLVLVMAFGSWHMRDAHKLFEAAPEQLYAGAGLAVSVSHIARYVHFKQSDRAMTAGFILSAVIMAGPWSFACLAYSTMHDVHAEEVLQAILNQSWLSLCIGFGAANMITASITVLLNCAWICSQAWATRSLAMYFFAALLLNNGLSSWRWLLVLAVISHMGSLNGRLRKQLENGDFTKELRQAPFRIGTQGIFDQVAIAACLMFWRTLQPLLTGLMRSLLPEELTVFASEIPIFELGEDVNLGIAAYYAPPRRRPDPKSTLDASPEDGGVAAEETAGHFVCNVGHIDVTHEAGLHDLQRTMNTLRDVWHEFRTENVRGFLANVVTFFPNIRTSTGSFVAKEINLSVWASEEDAHDWYAASKGHKNIMKQHAGGTLRTFGNLLSSLRPAGPVRYQDRCQRCCRLVESAQVGEPPPLRCTICGAKTFDYPLF